MKNEELIKYSNFSLLGIYDRNFKIFYADNPRLFRRLAAGNKKLIKQLRLRSNESGIIHEFQSEGLNYCAFIKPLENKTYICKIAEQLFDDEITNEELYKYIDNIKRSSLNVQSLARMVEDYAKRTDYDYDEFHACFKRLKLENASFYSDCHVLLSIFDNDNNAEFIPFLSYFLRTWDAVQYATRKIEKPFHIYLDPIFPCIKIDYSKFELAFYNIVKLVLIYAIGNIPPSIIIKTSGLENVEVSCEFPFRKDYAVDNCDLEIRAIKHIFRKMGGHFEIYEDDGKLCLFGEFKVQISCTTDDIAIGRDVEFIATAEDLRKKLNSDRYIHIYENIKENDKRYFASNIRELSVDYDEKFLIAEMFFSKVLLIDMD